MKTGIRGRPMGTPRGAPFGAWPAGKKVAVIPTTGASWSPLFWDHGSFTFSSVSKVATSATAVTSLVGSLTEISTPDVSKVYAELTIQFTGAARYGVKDSFDDVDNFVMVGQDGAAVSGSGGLPAFFTFVTGNIIGIALDTNTETIWFKNITTVSLWNNSGTDNPATGVGGVAFNLGGNPMSVAVIGESHATGTVFTLNTGPTFVGVKPAGFADWF